MTQDQDATKFVIDFGLRSDDYARQRPGFPDSFYERLEQFCPLNGARVLDLGTGPGIVALPLAERGAHVIGIDVSPQQIEAATIQAKERGLSDRCSFEVSRAEQTRFADASFDLITAGTCWHWFDHATALAEQARLLAPGGVLVIASYVYLTQHSPVAKQSEDLVKKYNPTWPLAGFNGLFPHHVDGVISDTMRLREQFCYDHDREFTHAAWRGRMRTCNGVGSGGMDEATVEKFDADLTAMLRDHHPEPLAIPHRIYCVVAERRG